MMLQPVMRSSAAIWPTRGASVYPLAATALKKPFTHVTEPVFPNSGHWLIEEQPAATIAAVRAFLSPP